MAKKQFVSKYTAQEIENILEKADEKPIVLYYDKSSKLYRGFASEERKELWISDNNAYAKYELFNFVAPAPFSINVSGLRDNVFLLQGQKDNEISYTFQTVDGNGKQINESVTASYTFENEGNTTTISRIYSAGTEAKLKIDNYIKSGENHITINLKGRTTSATEVIVLTYTVIDLNLSSNFNVNEVFSPSKDIDITYSVSGTWDKHIYVYVDGKQVGSDTVSALYPTLTKGLTIPNQFSSGKHTLQMYAAMEVNNITYKTKTLYFEFVVTGKEEDYTTIAYEYPSGVVLVNESPYINAEAYKQTELTWGFYTSNASILNTTVDWYTVKNSEKTLIKSVTVKNDNTVNLEALKFVPDEAGTYNLQAIANEKVIGQYTLQVVENSEGIAETKEKLRLKLSALGKSNTDSDAKSWAYKDITTTFNNVQWNSASGWNDNALVLNNSATATINYSPFSEQPTKNGMTFEIEFETFNVDDENAEVVTINNGRGGKIIITATKASLISNLESKETTLTTRYKNDERMKLAFVVNPNDSFLTKDVRIPMIINNGVLERVSVYPSTDSYDSLATIKLGNAEGKAGIKIYMIRAYATALNEDEEFNHYIIDSPNTEGLVDANDVYAKNSTVISVEKLQQKIDTILIDGDVSILGANKAKSYIVGRLERISPFDPTKNFVIENCTIRTHGQSTLGTPVPSMKFWSDKDGSVMYDADGNVISGGRYAFKDGALPTKKWVLQANYQDSSCVHNGGLERLATDTWYKAQVGSKYVLRTPPQEVQAKWEDEFHVKFPYQIRISPDSLPCVVCWRKDDNEDYQYLGQYVFMEDKKSDYLYGERSIYDNPNDPFLLNSKKKDADGNVLYERVWDNKNALQIEILRNTNEISMFMSDKTFWNPTKVDGVQWRWEQAFEFIYPDKEDMDAATYKANALIFEQNFVKKITDTYQNQALFEQTAASFLDLNKMAAYYIFLMRFGLVDNILRNAQIKTYDGVKWWFEFWDLDIALGLRNDGRLLFDAPIDRNTKDPDNKNAWAFGGRTLNMSEEEDDGTTIATNDDNTVYSCWLWDALENWEYFMKTVVPQIAQALFKGGLTYDNICNMFDKNYADYWCERLYNSNGRTKYLDEYHKGHGAAYLQNLQGKRMTHRHWWLKTSMDFWDAKWIVGDYTNKQLYFRTSAAPQGSPMVITAAKHSYFGWGKAGTDNLPVETGKELQKGETGTFYSDMTSFASDPFALYQPAYLEGVDLSAFAPYVDLILLGDCYDSVIGTNLKSLNFGVKYEDLINGKENSGTVSIEGMGYLTKLEECNFQGLAGTSNFDFSNMLNLKRLYLGDTAVASFTCANGTHFEKLYLNDSLKVMNLTDCDWDDIKFMNNTDYLYKDNIPSSLNRLEFTNMGESDNVKNFVFNWLNNLTDFKSSELIMDNLQWEEVPYEQLVVLAKIPKNQRKLSGYILISGDSLTDGELTPQQAAFLTDNFGEDIFDIGSTLVIDNKKGFVISAKGDSYRDENNNVCIIEGGKAQLSAVQFPIAKRSQDVEWGLQETLWDGYSDTIDYKSVSVNRRSGALTTTESKYDEYDVVVNVMDNQTGSNGNLDLFVKKRTYPSCIQIWRDGEENNESFINSTGRFIFNVVTDKEYTGTIKSYQWTFDDDEQSFIDSESTNSSQCCIKVTSLELGQVISKTLKISITYNNSTTLENTIYIRMVALAPILYASDGIGGNNALFTAIENLGFQHDNINYYTNVELAKVNQPLVIGDDCSNFNSRGYNVLDYFTNVPKLTLTCKNEFGDVDVRGMSKLEELIIENNEASTGTLNSLYIDNEKITQITVDNTITIQNAYIDNIPYGCAVDITANKIQNDLVFKNWQNDEIWNCINELGKFLQVSSSFDGNWTNADALNVIPYNIDIRGDGKCDDSLYNLHFLLSYKFKNISQKETKGTLYFSGTITCDTPVHKQYAEEIEGYTEAKVIANDGYYLYCYDYNANKLLTEWVNNYYGSGKYSTSDGVKLEWIEGKNFNMKVPSNVSYFPELKYFGSVSGLYGQNYTEILDDGNLKGFVLPNEQFTFGQSCFDATSESVKSFDCYWDLGSATDARRYQGSAKVKYLVLRGNSVMIWYGDDNVTPSSPSVLKSNGVVFVPLSMAYKYKTNSNYSKYTIVTLPVDGTDLFDLWYKEKVKGYDSKPLTNYINENTYTLD